MTDWKQKIEAQIADLRRYSYESDDSTDELRQLVDSMHNAATQLEVLLDVQAEIERLQATVEHLQDQCKEKHDSMIAMMNEALHLRAALERIRKYASAYTANRDISYLAAIAREALREANDE